MALTCALQGRSNLFRHLMRSQCDKGQGKDDSGGDGGASSARYRDDRSDTLLNQPGCGELAGENGLSLGE